MPPSARNEFSDGTFTLKQVDNIELLQSFDCGEEDLNDYFRNDAIHHKNELITQTYYISSTEDSSFPIALIDFCNDSLKIKKIEEYQSLFSVKPYPSFPAVKITRIGVARELQSQNIGTYALNMVKQMFTTNNRTGCRFLTVDAYNNSRTLNFYRNNGFQNIKQTVATGSTVAMFFDLKRFK